MGDRGLSAPHAQKLISPNQTFDMKSRFPTEPPVPPPSQPLPEKPFVLPSERGIVSARQKAREVSGVQPMLKRSDTEKPGAGYSFSGRTTKTTSGRREDDEQPPQQQQTSKLVEMLNTAQQEIHTQAEKLREMEEVLRKEREARTAAEARVERLESSKLIPGTDAPVSSTLETSSAPSPQQAPPLSPSEEDADVPARVQSKLDLMRSEMDSMRTAMERYRQRAEIAEADAEKNRKTLTEMVKGIRRREDAAAKEKHERLKALKKEGWMDGSDDESVGKSSSAHVLTNGDVAHKPARLRSFVDENGTITGPPARLRPSSDAQASPTAPSPEQKEGSQLATVLPQGAFAQSAPYASMLGVVLLGVGMMAYLNGWQNVARER